MSIREKCYRIVCEIPKGRVSTYKEVAESLGIKGYRAIGMILKKNPKPIEIPCHRVVKSNGEVGGYVGGIERKIELLREEGISIKNNKIVNFERYFFKIR
ncbi:MAG TPA: MGMT family protein [Methanothermococcus okinawensis]|uniref:MGMT family protein n=1 Tax=Methanothermococcus okinawensis TaxID=155863 RepID=A0A833DRD6_9EURY|nr:MGMT family protein [Methanothermococcus okinawensis]